MEKQKEEIITGGWLEGEIIRDEIICDRGTSRQCFKDNINANFVRQLREHGLVRQVSK